MFFFLYFAGNLKKEEILSRDRPSWINFSSLLWSRTKKSQKLQKKILHRIPSNKTTFDLYFSVDDLIEIILYGVWILNCSLSVMLLCGNGKKWIPILKGMVDNENRKNRKKHWIFVFIFYWSMINSDQYDTHFENVIGMQRGLGIT